MTGFCKTHVGERTDEELAARHKALVQRGVIGELGPGMRSELARVGLELEARGLRTDGTPIQDNTETN